MPKYTIDLPEKVEKEMREHYERDTQFYKQTKEAAPFKNFEEYIAYFIEDYLEEINDSPEEYE